MVQAELRGSFADSNQVVWDAGRNRLVWCDLVGIHRLQCTPNRANWLQCIACAGFAVAGQCSFPRDVGPLLSSQPFGSNEPTFTA